MLDWMELGIGWGLSLAVSLVAIAVLRRPLFNLLHHVCGTDVGARFWCSFFSILLVGTPLLLVSVGMGREANLALSLRHITACIITGLLCALFPLGVAIANARPRAVLPGTRP